MMASSICSSNGFYHGVSNAVYKRYKCYRQSRLTHTTSVVRWRVSWEMMILKKRRETFTVYRLHP